jgi:hypothetical protein
MKFNFILYQFCQLYFIPIAINLILSKLIFIFPAIFWLYFLQNFNFKFTETQFNFLDFKFQNLNSRFVMIIIKFPNLLRFLINLTKLYHSFFRE